MYDDYFQSYDPSGFYPPIYSTPESMHQLGQQNVPVNMIPANQNPLNLPAPQRANQRMGITPFSVDVRNAYMARAGICSGASTDGKLDYVRSHTQPPNDSSPMTERPKSIGGGGNANNIQSIDPSLIILFFVFVLVLCVMNKFNILIDKVAYIVQNINENSNKGGNTYYYAPPPGGIIIK